MSADRTKTVEVPHSRAWLPEAKIAVANHVRTETLEAPHSRTWLPESSVKGANRTSSPMRASPNQKGTETLEAPHGLTWLPELDKLLGSGEGEKEDFISQR